MKVHEVAIAAVFAIAILGAGSHAFGQSGDVVASVGFDKVSDKYLKWNAATCLFEDAPGAGDYKAELRKTDKGRIVFTPEEQTNPTFVAEAKKVAELGKAAGIEVTVLDNAYPDATRPVQVADQVVQLKPDVVLSQVVLPDLNPVIQNKYKTACLPMMNIFGMPNYPYPAPVVQAIHGENGVTMANAAVKLVKEKGWPAAEIWIITCADPNVSAGPGTSEDLIIRFRDTVKEALGVPDERISSPLYCSQADGPLGSKVATTDWATAHPGVKYVVGAAWNDTRGLGMAQGLEASNYTADNAIIAGRDANKEALAAMKAGSVLQVNLDLNLIDGWAIAMLAMAQDIIAGKAVPAFVVPAAKALTPKDL